MITNKWKIFLTKYRPAISSGSTFRFGDIRKSVRTSMALIDNPELPNKVGLAQIFGHSPAVAEKYYVKTQSIEYHAQGVKKIKSALLMNKKE